jgi:hypothetical protein
VRASTRTILSAALVALCLAVLAQRAAAAPPCSSPGVVSGSSCIYSYTNVGPTEETLTVPAGVSMTVTAYGAPGGRGEDNSGTLDGTPGGGGMEQGTFTFPIDETLTILVGEQGAQASAAGEGGGGAGDSAFFGELYQAGRAAAVPTFSPAVCRWWSPAASAAPPARRLQPAVRRSQDRAARARSPALQTPTSQTGAEALTASAEPAGAVASPEPATTSAWPVAAVAATPAAAGVATAPTVGGAGGGGSGYIASTGLTAGSATAQQGVWFSNTGEVIITLTSGAPTISWEPAPQSAWPSEVDYSGANWTPNSPVSVTFTGHNNPTDSITQTVQADGSGNINGTWTPASRICQR